MALKNQALVAAMSMLVGGLAPAPGFELEVDNDPQPKPDQKWPEGERLVRESELTPQQQAQVAQDRARASIRAYLERGALPDPIDALGSVQRAIREFEDKLVCANTPGSQRKAARSLGRLRAREREIQDFLSSAMEASS